MSLYSQLTIFFLFLSHFVCGLVSVHGATQKEVLSGGSANREGDMMSRIWVYGLKPHGRVSLQNQMILADSWLLLQVA